MVIMMVQLKHNYNSNSSAFDGWTWWRLMKMTLMMVLLQLWMMPISTTASNSNSKSKEGINALARQFSSFPYHNQHRQGQPYEPRFPYPEPDIMTDEMFYTLAKPMLFNTDVCASFCWGDLRCSVWVAKFVKAVKKEGIASSAIRDMDTDTAIAYGKAMCETNITKVFTRGCGSCGKYMHINHPLIICLIVLAILLILGGPAVAFLIGRKMGRSGGQKQQQDQNQNPSMYNPNGNAGARPQPSYQGQVQAPPSYRPSQINYQPQQQQQYSQ